MPAFEARPGMPYWQDLATAQPLKAEHFYSRLLGWEVGGDDYRVARKEGLPVAGFINQPYEMWLTYFLGYNGEAIERLGGKVLGEAEVSLGTMVVCQDPAGALFGLIDPAGEDQFVAAGEPGVPVWHEYVAPSTEAIDFYGELFDWEIRQEDGYFLALEDSAAFLGMRLAEGAPSGAWQTYLGVSDIDAAARQVTTLGGQVVAGPAMSPFGPIAAVEDATGAGVFLCQVEEPTFEEISEADSVL